MERKRRGLDMREEELRPRRSALFIPGANARALEKARTLPADVLILDLEDAVAPDVKPEARRRVAAACASGQFGRREVTIRINGLQTVWYADDLRAVAAAGPAAVVVPKVSSAADVQSVAGGLERAGAPDRTRIWAMLETPRAILRAEEIASSSERLAVLVMGTNDLAHELGAATVSGRQPLWLGLQMGVMAARIAGKVILDGVFNDLADAGGFAAECRQGRELGFDGKTLIHPSQLDTCNRVFAPTQAEIDQAQRIILTFAAAQAQGQGVVTLDGRMIENLHVDSARRVLALAAAIAQLD
jgi:citrate lyase subunit beta/citryl-CoA lyase